MYPISHTDGMEWNVVYIVNPTKPRDNNIQNISFSNYSQIVSFQQLAEVFAFFFSSGAAAERSISNLTVSRAVIDLALKEVTTEHGKL